MNVIIEGNVFVREEVEGTDVKECLSKLRARHPEISVNSIDDNEVVGFCESCGEPLFEDTPKYTDSDGVFICTAHGTPTEAI